MDQQIAKSLVRANVLAAAVFAVFLAAFVLLVDTGSYLATAAREKDPLVWMVEALSSIAIVIFVANAVSIRKAAAHARSNF